MNQVAAEFDVLETVRTAWSKVRGVKAIFLVWPFVLLLIQFLFVFLMQTLFKGIDIELFMAVETTVFQVILQMTIWGLVYAGTQRAFNKPIDYQTVAYGFDGPLFLKMLGLYILVGLIYFLPIIIFFALPAVFTFGMVLQWLMGLAGSVIMIFLFCRLFLAQIIVINEKVNPWVAIKNSFIATKNHSLQLIGLFLINIAFLFLGGLIFGIGLIWVIPYFYINLGEVYKVLKSKSPTVVLEA